MHRCRPVIRTMLRQIEIRSGAPLAVLTRSACGLAAVFPDLAVNARRTEDAPPRQITAHAGGLVIVPVARWQAPALDPIELDQAVAGALADRGRFTLRVVDGPDAGSDLLTPLLQVVTRCQRHLAGRNAASSTPFFDALLARHRALHDLDLPLVAADHDHALDAWRWVLRLEPQAGAEVQAAALFHDVERLVSEAEVRVEQDAPDYVAFKDAHAAAGARMTAGILASLGASADFVARVAELVAGHEHPGDDPDKALLNEADALSFFSLNAPGFARYYGPEHTARKVAYTLARLGARGRQALRGIRHRADIAALIERHSAAVSA
jgi:hypothetical protein